MKANFSLSFSVETDERTIPQIHARLDEHLAGQIKDLIAQALSGLDFDLQERYWLLMPEEEPPIIRERNTQEITVWLPSEEKFVEMKVGSADWFSLIESEKKFTYRYEGLTFTVRFEDRKSRGKTYHYWRAYATVASKLYTKQLGLTEKLTRESLDTVGVYFISLK